MSKFTPELHVVSTEHQKGVDSIGPFYHPSHQAQTFHAKPRRLRMCDAFYKVCNEHVACVCVCICVCMCVLCCVCSVVCVCVCVCEYVCEYLFITLR